MSDYQDKLREEIEPYVEEMCEVFEFIIKGFFLEGIKRTELVVQLAEQYKVVSLNLVAVEMAALAIEKILSRGLEVLEEEGLDIDDLPGEDDILH